MIHSLRSVLTVGLTAQLVGAVSFAFCCHGSSDAVGNKTGELPQLSRNHCTTFCLCLIMAGMKTSGYVTLNGNYD